MKLLRCVIECEVDMHGPGYTMQLQWCMVRPFIGRKARLWLKHAVNTVHD